ncbi:TonB-dependent receptor [Sphingobium naphthae]|uniref:TonB-dependent receptor n=2 Tax=Sphingobium naphthae TaxID=1886786 RepID=A0ABU3ZXK9_9SPHN|nr:TonB-dependent receptor [Sphingobium naphthae]MDV5824257.1 TonB-dependent receptor [Sphingobium naphthae]
MMSVAPGALMAQDDPVSGGAPQEAVDEVDEIIVTGQPERGAVIGEIEPEQQLSPADVRALGVTSIAEIITELEPQTNGTPIILLNGKRISSFSEIRDIPSEAVARVDILPEQVALSYGYAPTQKVVNIVLRQRFRSEKAELELGTTTEGGRDNAEIEAGLLRIRGDDRFSLDLEYSRAARLLESERDIVTTPSSRPYALGGNIAAGMSGAEVDPALSALAGQTVTVAAVPGSAASGAPSLADFVAGANVAAVTDLTPYRTLNPATENFSANATLARALGGVSATINGRLELSENDSLQGLSTAALGLAAGSPFSPFAQDVTLYRYLGQGGALGQQIRGTTGHVGVTLNGQIGRKWQWSFTGNGDLSITRTRTDRGIDTDAIQAALDAGDPSVNPYGDFAPGLLANRPIDTARAKSQAVTADLLVSGALFRMPAGDVMTSIRLGASANGFESRSVRSGVERSTDYSREIGSGQVSLDVPLTSRSKGVLGGIGDIGVNLNIAAQQLSDFGTLSTLGYGLRWQPIRAVQILASANQDRAAPTGAQITDPLISTPNVSVFDYATGQSVFVTQLSGGNAALRESVRDQFRLSARVKPFEKPNLTLTATYLNSRTTNPIAAFPTPTPDLEAAFPQRFLRDADGNLIQVDARPINFLRSQSEQLRWGFDLSIALKSHIQKVIEAWRASGSRPEDRPKELDDMRAAFGRNRAQGERPAGQDGAPPAGDSGERAGSGRDNAGPGDGGERPRGPGGGGFGGGRGRGDGQGGGRLSFSLYHTWHLEESILIAPGVPELDLLNGDATGSSGGQPRHEIKARVGYSNNGLGARLGVDWESGTHVDGALDGSSRLEFGSLATANLRLFANLGQMPSLVKNIPFLRGARVSLRVDNIFNQRREVRDATGMTPLRYQQDYLDPLGRTISISFRKLFTPNFGGARAGG